MSLAEKAKKDFAGYCRHCLKIKTKEAGVASLELNYAQRLVYAEIVRQSQAGQPVRIIVLKSRQIGMSTFSQAWLAHKAFTMEAQNCLTISQSLDMAGELFGKIEMMYSLLPSWVKPEKDSKTRGKRLALGAPLHSLLYVDSAENRDAGRSGTFQHVHATEIPLWPDAKRTMQGLLQSVPYKHGTSIIVESTAKGMGDYFHSMWKGAVEGTNGFTPIFVPWFDMPEYEREGVRGEKLPDFIKDICKTYNLSDEKGFFYLDKLGEFEGDTDLLAQEYPSSADEAFIASGRPFFHRKSIMHYRGKIEEPLRKGTWRKNLSGKVAFADDEGGDFWLWELPDPKKFYIIAADISTGRAKDFSTIQVLDGLTQVASYKGRAEPDQLADLLSWVGKVYGGAMLVPERNGVGLATVLRLLNEINYPNVYTHKRLDTTTGLESVQYGWTTTSSNRPSMLEELARVVRSGELTLRDSRTLGEMETFVFTDDLGKRAEANPGSNDDLVMALAIGIAVSAHYGSGSVELEYSHERFC